MGAETYSGCHPRRRGLGTVGQAAMYSTRIVDHGCTHRKHSVAVCRLRTITKGTASDVLTKNARRDDPRVGE